MRFLKLYALVAVLFYHIEAFIRAQYIWLPTLYDGVGDDMGSRLGMVFIYGVLATVISLLSAALMETSNNTFLKKYFS